MEKRCIDRRISSNVSGSNERLDHVRLMAALQHGLLGDRITVVARIGNDLAGQLNQGSVMMEKYTIEIEVEEVDREFRYCASVKEMPGCFTEASELQTLLANLYDAMSIWMDAEASNQEV